MNKKIALGIAIIAVGISAIFVFCCKKTPITEGDLAVREDVGIAVVDDVVTEKNNILANITSTSTVRTFKTVAGFSINCPAASTCIYYGESTDENVVQNQVQIKGKFGIFYIFVSKIPTTTVQDLLNSKRIESDRQYEQYVKDAKEYCSENFTTTKYEECVNSQLKEWSSTLEWKKMYIFKQNTVFADTGFGEGGRNLFVEIPEKGLSLMISTEYPVGRPILDFEKIISF